MMMIMKIKSCQRLALKQVYTTASVQFYSDSKIIRVSYLTVTNGYCPRITEPKLQFNSILGQNCNPFEWTAYVMDPLSVITDRGQSSLVPMVTIVNGNIGNVIQKIEKA